MATATAEFLAFLVLVESSGSFARTLSKALRCFSANFQFCARFGHPGQAADVARLDRLLPLRHGKAGEQIGRFRIEQIGFRDAAFLLGESGQNDKGFRIVGILHDGPLQGRPHIAWLIDAPNNWAMMICAGGKSGFFWTASFNFARHPSKFLFWKSLMAASISGGFCDVAGATGANSSEPVVGAAEARLPLNRRHSDKTASPDT